MPLVLGVFLGELETLECRLPDEKRIGGPRRGPIFDGSWGDRHLVGGSDSRWRDLTCPQGLWNAVPLLVQGNRAVLDLIAALRFRVWIELPSVGIDDFPVSVELDRNDVERLMNVARVVREHQQRLGVA